MFKVTIGGIESETIYIKVCGKVVPLLVMRPAGDNQPSADSDQAEAESSNQAEANGDRTTIYNGYASESDISPNKALNDSKGATGVLWIHGGGYATGMKEMTYMGRAQDLVRRHGAIVIAPGYHLSAFHPYPTGLKECYAALLFMKRHAKELGINPSQLMVGGESAGGGLTAAVCMMARDRGDVNIAFQMPLYPMIDNFDTDSSRDNHNKIWNTRRNHMAWKMYLRSDYGKEVFPYAAPARQKDYRNLPPAYTFVCTDEPFYCETLTFVDNLKKAGVEAKVDVYEGMYHAFDMMNPKHPTSHEAIINFNEHFEYAQKHYFKEN